MKTWQFGLLGHHISYSRSPEIYRSIWEQEGVVNSVYTLYDCEDISSFVTAVRHSAEWIGFNVTIPYKQVIIPYLDGLSPAAQHIGAVNTVVRIETPDGGCRLIGHNTDVDGFMTTLQHLHVASDLPALIAGTGGAYRAVREVFQSQSRPFIALSRSHHGENVITYDHVHDDLIRSHPLIVNCTPLGSTAYIDQAPMLPYDALTPQHFLIDLVYLPRETLFLREGRRRGATVINGECMLKAQAEAAWSLWRSQVSGRTEKG